MELACMSNKRDTNTTYVVIVSGPIQWNIRLKLHPLFKTLKKEKRVKHGVRSPYI
jgi:hypothetical protein